MLGERARKRHGDAWPAQRRGRDRRRPLDGPRAYALHTPQIDGDNTISINGNSVTGSKIGGSTDFFGQDAGAVHGEEMYVTYRADITSLGPVTSGPNTLVVNNMLFESNIPGGFPFDHGNDGAGVLVVYDDGSTAATIGIRDGSDASPLTPGYWKNHLAPVSSTCRPNNGCSNNGPWTSQYVPQSLGNYVVNTTAKVTAVFGAMNCSDAENCLAGHLLATKLNLANDSSTCISGTVANADAFLKGQVVMGVTGVVYAGPGSYSMTTAQRNRALALPGHAGRLQQPRLLAGNSSSRARGRRCRPLVSDLAERGVRTVLRHGHHRRGVAMGGAEAEEGPG